jgi:membrane protease YdiL (CAAX protease family)
MLAEKQWQPIQVLILGVLVMLSIFGAGLAIELAIRLARPHITGSGISLLKIVVGVLGFQGGALIWVHFCLKAHHTTWREAFGFSRDNKVQCIVAVVVAMPLVFGGVFALGALSDWGLRALHEQLNWSWLKPAPQAAVELLQEKWPAHLLILQGIVAIVLAPVGEEVLFRGILYTAIKQRGHKMLALWLTSVLFAAIHIYPAGFLSLIFLAIMLVAIWPGHTALNRTSAGYSGAKACVRPISAALEAV